MRGIKNRAFTKLTMCSRPFSKGYHWLRGGRLSLAEQSLRQKRSYHTQGRCPDIASVCVCVHVHTRVCLIACVQQAHHTTAKVKCA